MGKLHSLHAGRKNVTELVGRIFPELTTKAQMDTKEALKAFTFV
jgi:hypothetical protein